MRVVVNSEPTTVEEGTTVADLVAGMGHDPSLPGVAVAVDGTVVRRVDWATTAVADGQHLEILTAVQGGSA